jgi:hypothetical protein
MYTGFEIFRHWSQRVAMLWTLLSAKQLPALWNNWGIQCVSASSLPHADKKQHYSVRMPSGKTYNLININKNEINVTRASVGAFPWRAAFNRNRPDCGKQDLCCYCYWWCYFDMMTSKHTANNSEPPNLSPFSRITVNKCSGTLWMTILGSRFSARRSTISCGLQRRVVRTARRFEWTYLL